MVRTKTYTRIAGRGLISFLLLTSFSFAGNFKIGDITQVDGDITSMSYVGAPDVQPVKVNTPAQTESSYLTQDHAWMTIKLFNGGQIRLNPKSKFSLEYRPEDGVITLHLFAGSVKVLFRQVENDQKAQKLVVKSAGTLFETVNGKFSVVRSLITDTNSVYVEEGSVVAAQYVGSEKKDTEMIHAKEMTTVKDNDSDIQPPSEMKEKQIKFLHASQYLDKTAKDLDWN